MSGSARHVHLARRAADVLLACYPPVWKARYRDEVEALLDEGGADARSVASLAAAGAGAWVRPPEHLFDAPSRVRSSLATVLAAWTALAGLALIFGQLAQDQGIRSMTPGHPLTVWAYQTYSIAAHLSVGVVVVGGGPLWLSMLRQAWRRRDRRHLVLLSAPLVVPVVFLVLLVLGARLVRHSGGGGIGSGWFFAFTLLGLIAGALVVTGPALAMKRLRPAGAALRLASLAATVAASTMGVAAAASVVDAAGLYLWAPPANGFTQTWFLSLYFPTVAAAAAVALISAARGARAIRTIR